MRIYRRALAVGRSRSTCSLIAVAATIAAIAGGPAASQATAETPAHTDVLFLFDTSGSMSGELNEAKEKVASVMEAVSAHLPDVEFGVANVEDVPGYEEGAFEFTLSEQEYAENEEKAWQLDQAITSERSAVSSAIEHLKIVGGGDGPEAYSRALWEPDTNPNVGWRQGARHEIVLIADNVPHDTNLNVGLPESDWIESPAFDTSEEPGGRFGIPTTKWSPGTDLETRDAPGELALNGKPLEAIEFFGSETRYLPYWEYWAGLSGGQALDGSSGELATALTSIIETGATKALPACPPGQVRIGEGACIVPPKPSSHSTATQVICNLEIATATDTCTATVGDAAPSGSTNPTGTVTFATKNGGVFLAGNTCQLKATVPGNTSSCSAQFAPPSKPASFPEIVATYSGDETHNSSTGETHYGPASALEHLIDLSQAGTIKPGGEVVIPISCQFPCDTSGDLFTQPDLGNIASVASLSAQVETIATGARHGKGKRRKRHKPVLLGAGRVKLSKPGKGKLVLKPTRKGRHALAGVKAGSLHLTLKFTVHTLNGTLVVTKSQRVTLRKQRKAHGKHH